MNIPFFVELINLDWMKYKMDEKEFEEICIRLVRYISTKINEHCESTTEKKAAVASCIAEIISGVEIEKDEKMQILLHMAQKLYDDDMMQTRLGD